jgi:hypothetical protein
MSQTKTYFNDPGSSALQIQEGNAEAPDTSRKGGGRLDQYRAISEICDKLGFKDHFIGDKT